MEQRKKRVALVTGANKGIGLEIARQLGRAEVTVLIGARDNDRGRAAVDRLRQEDLDAWFVPLDVTDETSVRNAAACIAADHERLDILINNAGVSDANDGPPSTGSIASARRLIETNFLGALAVTQAMLPLLLQSSNGRIVNMSSTLGSLTGNGDASSEFYGVRLIGYNASKAALNMLTVQLAEELRDRGITVNSACPGYVRTDLNGNRGYVSLPEAAAIPVRLALLRRDAPTGTFLGAEGHVAW
ncbi:SDR family oxidoreductase [Pararobbsia silviterrae]|uniref:SDR family oxidoreductase n=1 Tax=Pararobbsia silviterrae TaxID=1792498 RepID=A0A494XT35_9BURK|nr:SDR family oxidoreductase [Pararobbsia silviterrae]RKP53769.1 SDR family oxidoreductase [Pararobbsia silviterrae]